MQEELEADALRLNEAERKTLYQILKLFLAHQAQKDGDGYYIRKKDIYINDKNFLKKHTHQKGFKGLKEKGVLQHYIYYKIVIKKDYIDQVYVLLDTQDWELVLQLAGVWLERVK